MANVLVTGANGFIGSHLVESLLSRGDRVTCLVRKTSQLEWLRPLGVQLAFGDVTDFQSLSDPISGQEVVYHLAACPRSLRARQFYEVNQQGADNLARTCAEQENPPLLLLVSSLAAAQPARDGQPVSEGVASAPVSHYGRSKRAGELAVSRWADRVPVTIIRAGGVFGERDRGCLEMFKPIARLGMHFVPSWPTLGVSMIHAADLVKLLILAVERGSRIEHSGVDETHNWRGYYFAACDEYPDYVELGRLMGRALGRQRVFAVRIPRPFMWGMGVANEIVSHLRRRPAMLGLDKVREATAGLWFCSSKRAAEELGFSVSASLGDRFLQTVQWYRQVEWL